MVQRLVATAIALTDDDHYRVTLYVDDAPGSVTTVRRTYDTKDEATRALGRARAAATKQTRGSEIE